VRILGLVLVLIVAWISPLWAGDEVKDIFCSDYRNYQVFWIKNKTIDKIAAAGLTKDQVPIIRYNPEALVDLSPQTRKFALNFECANHLFGYTSEILNKFADLENRVGKADCWAISRMFYDDGLSSADVAAITKEINNLSKEQWARFPGPTRVINFDSCALIR